MLLIINFQEVKFAIISNNLSAVFSTQHNYEISVHCDIKDIFGL
jgi:hypothetical protein